MSSRLQLFCVLAAVAVTVTMVQGRSTGSAPTNDLPDSRVKTKTDVSGYLADIRLLFKVYEECSAAELATCLKKKVVVALDRAGRTAKKLTLMEGVQVVKDLSVPDPAPITEEELESTLPRSLEDKDYALDQMIFDKIIHFFESHTLEFKIIEAEGRGLEEGRRRNRYHSLFMYPLLLGGTFIPLAFGALALLAGKALIVSKLALALAAIVGLKKLVGGGGGESYQVVQVPHHGGGGHYKRSLEDSEAQELAYRGYVSITTPADKLKGA